MSKNYTFIKSMLKRKYLIQKAELETEIDSELFEFDKMDPSDPRFEMLKNKKLFLDEEYKIFESNYQLFEKIFIESLKGSSPEDIKKCFLYILEKNNMSLRFTLGKLEKTSKATSNAEKIKYLKEELYTNLKELQQIKEMPLNEISSIFEDLVYEAGKMETPKYQEVTARDSFIYNILRTGEYTKEFFSFIKRSKERFNSSLLNFKDTNIPNDRLEKCLSDIKDELQDTRFDSLTEKRMMNEKYSMEEIDDMIKTSDKLVDETQFNLLGELKYYNVGKYSEIVQQMNVSKISICSELIRNFNDDKIIPNELVEAFYNNRSRMAKLEKKKMFVKDSEREELEEYKELIRKIIKIIEEKILSVYNEVCKYVFLYKSAPINNILFFRDCRERIESRFINYCDDMYKICCYLQENKEAIFAKTKDEALKLASKTPFRNITGEEDWNLDTLECIKLYKNVYLSKLFEHFSDESNEIITQVNKAKKTNLGFAMQYKRFGN